MSQFGGGGAKNPPWVRQGQSMGMGVAPQQGQMQQQMMAPLGNSTAAMLQYPQAQMFQQSQLSQLQQSGMTMQTMGGLGTNQLTSSGQLSASLQASNAGLQQQPQMYSQVGTVSYPTRTAIIASPYATPAASQQSLVSNSQQPSSNAGPQPKQRVFTGTVTKVQDNFGFVDEEVFFQTSCCVKGSNPQVGDRVLVEAMYNASMPFKWNATRIQVLPMDNSSSYSGNVVGGGGERRNRFSNSGGYNSVPPPSGDMMGGNDFARRNRNKRERQKERDDDFEARKRRREEQQQKNQERREERERETLKEKEKDKEKEKERAKSPRKRSKSPRRRKARVVPRYMVQIPKIALDMPEADVMEIKKRYNNLYIPSDFFVSSFKWVEVFPPHRPLTLERPCAFHVMHKDVDPVIENNAVLDPPDADYLFSAKVMLLSMPELDEIYQKCCAQADDKKEGSYDDRDFVHPTRLINFLVGTRGKNETMAIGGPWSPSLDGPNPEKDPTVLIKTAIRTCKALTGVDLTPCSQWYRFVEIYYHRAESVHKGKTIPARVETVSLFLPDIWNCLPTRLEWDGLHLNYKKQLDRLLNQEEEAEGDDKDTSIGEIQKKEPTHYAQLDPKVMKVNELREELEARSLSPKGLKSQLTARLAKVLKTEQEKEEEENAAKTEGAKTAKAEKDEKDEEKKKKEEEERKKLDEKERQLVEKRHTLPEKSHILVHPSRTAKSGKFDCTVMSLSVLLDYRPEDSKEHSFEVSLFAELFNEMLMRDFGFCIYKALIAAPEKPKDEKEDKDKKEKDKKSDDKKDKDEKKDDKKDDKKDGKKDDRKSVEDDSASVDDKSEDKKKKEKVKLHTVDPYLLLAFVYFDQTHCGYIFDKDIEELLFTLGLNLSRAQVKKLVQKVVARDSLHYRKLTDKPKDEVAAKQNGVQPVEDQQSLALGNKRLFPIFDEGNTSSKRNRKGGSEKKQDGSDLPSGFVMHNGSLIDINKLQAQLKRSEDSRTKIEKILETLRADHGQLKDTNGKNVSTIKRLANELKDFKERLNNTSSELCNMDGKTRLYYSVMTEIYEKLTPVVGSRPSVKEETIEDVEMEDIQDSAREALVKKETSEVQSTSSNSPVKNAENVKTNIPIKTKEEEDKHISTIKVGPVEADKGNKVEIHTDSSSESKQDAVSKVEVKVESSKENKQDATSKVEVTVGEKENKKEEIVSVKVEEKQDAGEEEPKTETDSKVKGSALSKKVENVEKASPLRTTRSTEEKKASPAKK